MDHVPLTPNSPKGQQYLIPESHELSMGLIGEMPGLSKDERYLLRTIFALALKNPNRQTDEEAVANQISKASKRTAPITVRKKVLVLSQLGLFSRQEISVKGRRPIALFVLNDLMNLMDDPVLKEREHEVSENPIARIKHIVANEDDEAILQGSPQFPHSYSQKITNLILRRCSSDPDHLNVRVEIPMHGYEETLLVAQTAPAGAKPMDGSEDRLQQAILTMFKMFVKQAKILKPSLRPQEIENNFLLDMRQVCKTMKLRPSSANIEAQAKKLWQLYLNEFVFFFKKNSMAAKQLNLTSTPLSQFIVDSEAETEIQVEEQTARRRFLASVIPLSEVTSEMRQGVLSLESQSQESRDFSEEHFMSKRDPNSDIYDNLGRLHRFYRIKFDDITFREVVEEGLRQIFMQPSSMLEEDRTIVRGLTYLSQRILRKNSNFVYQQTWGAIGLEIAKLRMEKEERYVFDQIQRFLSLDFERSFANDGISTKWKPTREGQPEKEIRCITFAHGYCYEAFIPKGVVNRRDWILKISRDRNNEITGDNGPAAKALALAAMSESKNGGRKSSNK